jgi:hypothetical protein
LWVERKTPEDGIYPAKEDRDGFKKAYHVFLCNLRVFSKARRKSVQLEEPCRNMVSR